MKKKIYILISIIILISSFFLLWWYQALKPANPDDNKTINFSIEKGESIRNIAEKLQKEGILRSSVAFFLITRFGGIAQNIQAGDFRLNPAMNLWTIVEELQHGKSDMKITIPEGWRKEEIALLLSKELSIPESEFLKDAHEGYLFPDTYLVPKDATSASIINYFSRNFEAKIGGELRKKASDKNISINDAIIIASMVEREAKFPEDRPLIASVILNRLKIGMKLDIDATVQYALGYQNDTKSWWKKDLTKVDLDIESPFNTYKNQGLPPAPISNPGLSSIEAVLNAPDTQYIYYIADSSGRSHFAKDLTAHNLNIKKYIPSSQ